MSSELVPATLAELAADAELSDGTRERLQRSVPDNTKRPYSRQWQVFANWCTEHGRTPMPATPQTLAEYGSHLEVVPYRA